MLGTHTFPAAAEHSKRQWRHRITIAPTVAQKVMSEIMKRINNVMPIISGPCFGFAGIFVHELRIVLAKLVLSGKKQEVVEE